MAFERAVFVEDQCVVGRDRSHYQRHFELVGREHIFDRAVPMGLGSPRRLGHIELLAVTWRERVTYNGCR